MMLSIVKPKLLTAEVIQEYRRQYPNHSLSLCVHTDHYEAFKELDTFIRVVPSDFLRKFDDEGNPIGYIMATPPIPIQNYDQWRDFFRNQNYSQARLLPLSFLSVAPADYSRRVNPLR